MPLPAASSMPGFSAAGGQPSPSPSGTPTNSPTVTASGVALPSDCEDVLTAGEVDRILGRRLGGTTQYIKGVAEPAIARTGRVTCRYGVPVNPTESPHNPRRRGTGQAAGQPSVVPVELGLSTYTDAESASQRVDFTVHEQRILGARQTQVTVLNKPAILVSGGRTDPLLVMSDGNLTLALSLVRTLVAEDQTNAVLTTIAESVFRHLR